MPECLSLGWDDLYLPFYYLDFSVFCTEANDITVME